MTDDGLMEMALVQAQIGVRQGEGEVGVVIARSGHVVYAGHNRIATNHDITAHAEIDALRTVSRHFGDPFLPGFDLFCTLEPCGMCTCACAWARLGRVVFGAPKSSVPARYFELDADLDAPGIARHARDRLQVVPGVRGGACVDFYRRLSRDHPAA